MKYCTKCGAQIFDEAIFCPKCGAPTQDETDKTSATLTLVAKIFMIIGCVVQGAYLIPLCWTIPMTVSYFKSVENHQPISTAFKVCSLIFVSPVAGIIMLCQDDMKNIMQ